MKWRYLGQKRYRELQLTHLARNVFEIKVPIAEFESDFEYYFEVEAGENSLVYSATARAINCSVVVF